MRFAIIGSRGYPSTYGGFETFVRRFAPYLVAHGDEVTVFCRDGERGTQTIDGVRCVTTRGIESTKLSTLSFGLSSCWSARHGRFDAALVLNVANGYFLPLLKRVGIPTAVNVDGIEWERGKWNRVGKAVFLHGAKMTAKYADEIIVDSREIGRIWKTQFGRQGTFIPYGADVVGHTESDRIAEHGLTSGTYALVVARIVPENNVDLFLDALELIPEQAAVVVGSASDTDDPTANRLRRFGTTRRNFHWLGHVKDQDLLSQLWAHSGAYFHGHSVGGTNPALLQALGHGAPTIALRTPYNVEVLGSEDQTFLPEPSEVAHRIRQLTASASEREKLGRLGAATIANRYTWDSVLSDYRALLHRVAGMRGVRQP